MPRRRATATPPSISPDGRFITFWSAAPLHPSDTNTTGDIYLSDRLTGTIELISKTPSGGPQNNGNSYHPPSVSADGRYVAFSTAATNLLGGDLNTAPKFASPGLVTLPSGALSASTTESVEAWFKTESSGVVIGMQNAAYPTTPTTRQPVLWVGSDGLLRGQFRTGTVNPIVSPTVVNDNRWHHAVLTAAGSTQTLYLDGNSVGTRTGLLSHSTMTSAQIGMGRGDGFPGLTTGWVGFAGLIDEVAIYRTALSATRIATHFNQRSGGYSTAVAADSPWAYWRLGESSGTSAVDASGAGRTAIYAASGITLADGGALTGDNNNVFDVYVRDRQTNTTALASKTWNGDQLTRDSRHSSLSADGRLVGYHTAAPAVPTDTNSVDDIYIATPAGTSVERVSLTDSDTQGNGASSLSWWGALSNDGRYVAFQSTATNLVTGDNNTLRDVFVRDRQVAGPVDWDSDSDNFAQLWLPRIADQMFIDSLLARIGYPAEILAEGFHDLGEPAQLALARCLLQNDLLARFPGVSITEPQFEALADLLRRLVFDKINLLLAPSNVTAVRGDRQATVTWDAPALSIDGLTTYNVTAYRASDNAAVATTTTTAPTTTVTVTGLRNGTPVYFRVSASYLVLNGPESSPSNTVTPAGPPFAPENVIATRGDQQATVSWASPSERPDGTPGHNGEPITSYTIFASPGGQTVAVDGATTTATVGGLRNGTAYTFTVTATNIVGTGPASAPSNSVIPAGPPFPPEGVTASAADRQATITWSAPSPRADGTPGDNGDPITSYTIIASPGGQSMTVDGTDTSTVVPNLTNGTTYTFTVTATNAVGTSTPSNRSNPVTPFGPPSAPTNVTAFPADSGAFVTWTASSSNGASVSYTVRSSPGDLTVTTSATSAPVGGLTNGATYTFTVTAMNAGGTSPPSAPSNPVTPAAGPSPVSDVAVSGGRESVTVSWSPSDPHGAPVTYQITSSPDGISRTTTSTSVTFTGLTHGTVYTFTVIATNSAGYSAPVESPEVVPLAPPRVELGCGDGIGYYSDDSCIEIDDTFVGYVETPTRPPSAPPTVKPGAPGGGTAILLMAVWLLDQLSNQATNPDDQTRQILRDFFPGLLDGTESRQDTRLRQFDGCRRNDMQIVVPTTIYHVMSLAINAKTSSGINYFNEDSTVAYGYYCVDGKFGTGVTRNGGPSRVLPPGFSPARSFEPFVVEGGDYHAETNLLANFRSHIPLIPGSPADGGSEGIIVMVTSREVCWRCRLAIEAFERTYPGIELVIVEPDDGLIVPAQ